jgi:serine/threonine protein kinase
MSDLPPHDGKAYGHYRIQYQLGAGGMGVVYSAYDLVLERTVAIKVVSERAVVDKTARALLIHEARTASSLNHPNICTIHEVGDLDGEAYIVMEQVEGQPLSALLGPSGASPNLVVRYGPQIADALAHAHERGVIHRDLKSTNVMITPEGRVKVLDFGLAARIGERELHEATASRSPLEESRLTIVGTLPYLAPELLRGEPAEARTDIWALGVLLFEMACGAHPFCGRTAFELSSAILREAPTPFPTTVPSSFRAIILRCLEKSASDRYQQSSDVRADLQLLDRDSDSRRSPDLVQPVPYDGVPKARTQPRSVRKASVVAGGLVVLLAAIFINRWLTPLPPPKVLHINQLTHFGHVASWGKINTDGERLFYLRREPDGLSMMQVPVSGGESQPLPMPFRNARISSLSPDRSEFLLETYSGDAENMEFWLLPVVGGSPRRLGDLTGRDVEFSPNGREITYSRTDGIYICNRNGSGAHRWISLPNVSWGLAWSPDGSALRFTLQDPKMVNYSIWEVSADGNNLHLLFPDRDPSQYECCGQWSADGRYFFFASTKGEPPNGLGSVWARREKRSSTPWFRPSLPVRLTTAPVSFGFLRPSFDGQKLYATGLAHEQNELLRASHDKKSLMPIFGSSDVHAASLSPNGDWLAVIMSDWTLWRSRPDGTERIELTADFGGYADMPHWSPDGRWIVFEGHRTGHPINIYKVSADGGPSEELLPNDQPHEIPDWSHDGESIVYSVPRLSETAPKENSGIFILNLASRKSTRILGSEGMSDGKLSFDGRYLGALSAYQKKLMVYDFQTRNWKEIAHGNSFYRLEGTPGRKYFYFQDIVSAGEPLYRTRVGDWKVERVMSFESMLVADVVRCRFAGLLQDGSPMVIAVRGGYELYEMDLDVP